MRYPLLLLPTLLAATTAHAQHDMHRMAPAPADTARAASHRQHAGHAMPATAPADTSRHTGHSMSGMSHDGMEMGGDMNMSHAYSRNLPMSRNGSGTAWNPDNTPMFMWMHHKGQWMVMNHGAVNVRYTRQNLGRNSGQRGGSTFDAPNWFMTMAQRTIGQKGLLNLTAMISLDPLTEGGNGYPLLFQSGEAYRGQPLVDRQHPHDLFSALSVAYTHSLSEDVDVTAYLGYPGEPAIGPVAFMHRISAMPNPDAALGHHWQDATHITFGVATLGVRYKQFKLEGSNFTGREPNEHRYGFDRPRADSWAARLNWNPTPSLALQASRAFIKSPEELHVDEDVKRTTASIIQSSQWGYYRFITSALVWGMNQHVEGGHTHEAAHSVLAETNVQLGKPAVYGRYEFVQKSNEELQLLPRDFPPYNLAVYNIHALTLGANYRIAQVAKTDLTVGAQATVYRPEGDLLKDVYYGSTPVSGQVYLRLNPSLLRMSKM